MIEKDLQDLLKKAEELQALFALGQRVVPFLEEIVIFVSETMPLLDEINISIEENIQKMPKVSSQISKVTQATENAATEIMDTLDGMTFKTNRMSENLQRIRELAERADEDGRLGFPELIDNCDALLLSVMDDSGNIMMALQVQDITSQQLFAVNNLLETIQQKLARILSHFRSSGMNDLMGNAKTNRTPEDEAYETQAFDPEAVEAFSTIGDRQTEVDALVSIHRQEAPAQDGPQAFFTNHEKGNGEVSQNEIDIIFKK